MTFDVQAVARALGGYASQGRAHVPAPGHKKGDRSAVLWAAPNLRGGFYLKLFSAGDPLAVKEEFIRTLQPRGLVTAGSRAGFRGSPALKVVASPAQREGLTEEEQVRVRQAMAIWEEAMPPQGTPVERYLARRGLTLPPASEDVLRYHPRCPFGKRRTPAMVALVRDVRKDYPRGIHRTALTFDGRKAWVDGMDRLTLGPIGGGAVKLTPEADLGACLGVGEGIESTLSLQLIPEFAGSAVWSLISSGGIKKLPVLPGIDGLWIAVDHDEAGLTAARECANRWRKVETMLVRARKPETDLNNLVTKEDGNA